MGDSDTVLLMVILAFCTPVIVAIVQGLKQAGMTSARFALAASVVTGVVIAALVALTDIVDGFDLEHDLALTVLAGILSGLGASGLYSGVRAAVTGVSVSNPHG